MLVIRSSFVGLVLIAAVVGSSPAQTRHPSPIESPGARVAALATALYNAQANVIEASDTARSLLATKVLDSTLADRLGPQLVDPAEIRRAADAPSTQALTGGLPCNVIVACAREVARRANARWVVLTKVSKTSNLIWLLTGQLVHVPTGKIVLDDSTELKGEPGAMVRVGARIFAERVARTVRAGGVANDFPTP